MSEYKDRFSSAEREQQEKSAFTCKTCNTNYSAKQAKEKMMSCCGRSLSELLKESVGP